MEVTAFLEDGELGAELFVSRHRIAVFAVDERFLRWSGIVDGKQFSGRVELPPNATELLREVQAPSSDFLFTKNGRSYRVDEDGDLLTWGKSGWIYYGQPGYDSPYLSDYQ